MPSSIRLSTGTHPEPSPRTLRSRPPPRPRTAFRRRRLAGLGGALLAAAALVVAALWLFGSDEPAAATLVPRAELPADDPLAYEEGRNEDLERAAAFGLSQPLYAKSPGGVFTAARRTASFRPLVEGAVDRSGFDADIVEAIVFLESGGRPDVIAGDDPANASGLTQILAETAQNFLGMDVDLAESRSLTVSIAGAERRGQRARAERLRARRRQVDARFDPEQALAGTVRYLATARELLGRDDFAVVSYHMGIGNLSNVLRAYAGGGVQQEVPDLVDEHDLSWTRVFFDTASDRHPAAHALLGGLSDDSPTYYWRVLAAREIMRLYRDDPDRLRELDLLHRSKASAEEVLHPPFESERFADPSEVLAAWNEKTLHPLPNAPGRLHFRVSPGLGELASELDQPRELYRGLRADALALLLYTARRVHELSGARQPLVVTSAVRDDAYQELLRGRNAEAAEDYSLHTTGYAFDIRRRYESGAQAQAFQFVLDRLTAHGLIAWVREPSAIHVTASRDADVLVPHFLEREP